MKEEINLKTISFKLVETVEELGKKLANFYKTEMEYTTFYNKRLLRSGMATQALKEAEVLEGLKLEPIYEKYQTLKLEIKLLYMRVEVYKEVSRNIRSLAFNDI